MTESGATLELRAARFRDGAEALTEALTLHSEARAVGLVGEWGALFRALTGAIVEGEARVCGVALRDALASGTVSVAPCDPELPPSFTITEYLELAAHLVHGSRSRAKQEVTRALERFSLANAAKRKLAELPLVERRLLVVAAATLGAPTACLLEAPLRGLDAAASDRLVRACALVSEQCRLIVSSAPPTTPSPARALLDSCGELFWLENGKLGASGSAQMLLASSSRYHATFAGSHSKPLAEALVASGCRVALRDEGAINGKPATRYTIELPARAAASTIIDTAAGSGVTLLELEPVHDR